MAMKIHRDLQYYDHVFGQYRSGTLDMDRVRESVTRQNSDGGIYGVGFEEGAERMGVARSTAQHRIRRLALSSRDRLPVNSCYSVAWLDVTNNRLINPTAFEEQVPVGSVPVFLEDFARTNRRYEQGKKALSSMYGKRGGRGQRKER